MAKTAKHPLHMNVPITKVDEEKRMVWGYATVEELDSADTIITYEASKKAFSKWIGNIREMHNPIAIGKKVEVQFDDANKGVWLGAFVSESTDGENAWIKVKEGVLQGFSIGGSTKDYEFRDYDGQEILTITDYDLAEVSLVDNPACPSCTLQIVKRDQSGDLARIEKMRKRSGQPVHWFERAYHYSTKQKPIESGVLVYNKSDMANSVKTIERNVYSAAELTNLGMRLAETIWYMDYKGEDADELKDALENIKSAAAGELGKPEKWPSDVEDSIELAQKAVDLKKGEIAMAKKEVQKSVVGQEDRDRHGEVTTTAEENGKPADDATTAPVAEDTETTEETTNEETETKTETTDEGKKDDEGTETDTDKSDKTTDKKETKKATEASDLQKSILAGVSELIDQKLAPVIERVDELGGKPAENKAVAAFADIEKGQSMEAEQTDAKDAFDKDLKRAEELAADANVGTPAERTQLAMRLRKHARAGDPRIAIIKSQFPQQ